MIRWSSASTEPPDVLPSATWPNNRVNPKEDPLQESTKEEDLLNENITGIIFIPESALIDKKIQYAKLLYFFPFFFVGAVMYNRNK